MITVPPEVAVVIATHNPAPCMNGGVGRMRSVRLRATATTSSTDSKGLPSRRASPSGPATMSPIRQRTPFGSPVVPPVNTMCTSSALGSVGGGLGDEAAMAVS